MQNEDRSDGATARPPTWQQQPAMPAETSAAFENGHDGILHYTSARGQPDGHMQRHIPQERARGNTAMISALGWLSIGLGLAQLLAPRSLARASGLTGVSPLLIRVIGLRELACGVGLLRGETRPAWRWSRVAGDAMDLSLLGVAMTSRRNGRARLATTAAVVAGVTAIDYLASTQLAPRKLSELPGPGEEGLALQKSVIVNRSADDCYRAWRDLENLPRFMPGLQSVQVIDARRSRWNSVEGVWIGELTQEHPGQGMRWRAAENHAETGALELSPAPGGHGTVVTLQLHMQAPVGKAGAAIAGLFSQAPAYKIDTTLRRFKQWMETGEVSTTAGQPSGKRSFKTRLLDKAANKAGNNAGNKAHAAGTQTNGGLS